MINRWSNQCVDTIEISLHKYVSHGCRKKRVALKKWSDYKISQQLYPESGDVVLGNKYQAIIVIYKFN